MSIESTRLNFSCSLLQQLLYSAGSLVPVVPVPHGTYLSILPFAPPRGGWRPWRAPPAGTNRRHRSSRPRLLCVARGTSFPPHLSIYPATANAPCACNDRPHGVSAPSPTSVRRPPRLGHLKQVGGSSRGEGDSAHLPSRAGPGSARWCHRRCVEQQAPSRTFTIDGLRRGRRSPILLHVGRLHLYHGVYGTGHARVTAPLSRKCTLLAPDVDG